MSRKLSTLTFWTAFSLYSAIGVWAAEPTASPPPLRADQILERLRRTSAKGPQCPYDKSRIPNGLGFVCDDMARFTCRDGTFTDGTGDSRSVSEVRELVRKWETAALPRYEKALKDFFQGVETGRASLLQVALKAVKMESSPDCQSDFKQRKSDLNEACLNHVVNALSKAFAHNDYLYPLSDDKVENEALAPFDLAALSELIENRKVRNALAPLTAQSLDQIDQHKEKESVKAVFEKVRSQLVKKVEVWGKASHVAPEKIKRIQDKLMLIEYTGTHCGYNVEEGIEFERNRGALMEPNAYYMAESNEFRVCNGVLLQGNSKFNLAYIIGHELAHSIDPCSLARGTDAIMDYTSPQDVKSCEREFLFKDVIQCLRNTNSLGALRKEWATPRAAREKFRSKQILESKKLMGKGEKVDSALCANDQVGEAFADWASVEVLPDYIDSEYPQLSQTQKLLGYSHSLRFLCGAHPSFVDGGTRVASDAFGKHPHSFDRINRILMANPRIRADLGCGTAETTPAHCSPGQKPSGQSAEEIVLRTVDAVQPKPNGKSK